MSAKFNLGERVTHQARITLGPIGSATTGVVTRVSGWGLCYRYSLRTDDGRQVDSCEEHYLTRAKQ